MACRIVVGNLLDQPDLSPTFGLTVGSEDPNFPAAFLHDGPGALPWRSSDELLANDNFRHEASLIRQLAADWTVVNGAVEDSTDHDHGTGSSVATSLKLTAHASAELRQRCTLRAGLRYKAEAWAGFTGASSTGKVGLYSPDIRKWWNPAGGGSWVSSPTYILIVDPATSSFQGAGADAGVLFTAPTSEEVLAQTTLLDVVLIGLGANVDPVYFDDISIVAGVDFVGVMGGHNLPGWMTVDWISSEANGTPHNRGTFTKRQHSFFIFLDEMIFDPVHQIRLGQGEGAPDYQLYVGELIIGQTEDLPRSPFASGFVLAHDEKQARNATPGGTEWVANRGPAPIRTLQAKFRFADEAEREAARAILVDKLRGGAVPCVFLPETNDFPELAIFGRLQASISFDLQPRRGHLPDDSVGFESFVDLDVVVTEAPMSSIP